eukprot:scaffold1353_cov161-Amphora_coffeaeformis.AAC.4
MALAAESIERATRALAADLFGKVKESNNELVEQGTQDVKGIVEQGTQGIKGIVEQGAQANQDAAGLLFDKASAFLAANMQSTFNSINSRPTSLPEAIVVPNLPQDDSKKTPSASAKSTPINTSTEKKRKAVARALCS